MDIYAKIEDKLKAGDARFVIRELGGDNSNALPDVYKNDANHAYYLLGSAYYAIGRFSAARRAFARSLRCWGLDFDCVLAIGNCYSELKMPLAAIRYFKKGAFYCPDKRTRGIFSYNCGNALYDLGRYRAAIFYYRRAIRLNDGLGGAYRNLDASLKKVCNNSNCFEGGAVGCRRRFKNSAN